MSIKATALVLMGFLLALSAAVSAQERVAVPAKGKWAERAALSVIHRSPEAWAMRDYRLLEKPTWGYTYGLTLLGMQKLYEKNGDERYLEYGKVYVDQLINERGEIKDYDLSEFNIDHVNPGKLLFLLYEKTGDERYKTVLKTLATQLDWQPRTRTGGYWHKRIYPYQMWLDGLYMGAAFEAQYAAVFNEPERFDDIAHQFILIESKTRDPKTGLLYHAWDESKVQRWADPETGLSKHFWSRAIGWYAMALVDALEYFPADHKDRQALIDILNRTAAALEPFQHRSGLWYQVLDQGDRYGNYLEASGSAMFSYAFAKGVRLGYLPRKYQRSAERAHAGLVKELVDVDRNNVVHLNGICGSAGLGGSPYRPGTFEYYVGEAIRPNDPHGVGPFILASVELDR